MVDASDLLPSHDAREGFRANAGSDPNERRYEDPTEGKASRDTVLRIAKEPKAGILYSDAPTATDGPPITTESGVVLGGNARTMGVQLAYKRGGATATALRNATHDAAAKFGIPVNTTSGRVFKDPIIVRTLSGKDAGAPGELSRVLNQSLTTAKSRATEAVSRGGKITESVASEIAGAVGDSTLADALSDGRKTARIIKALRGSGAFSDADLVQMLEGAGQGKISPAGKSAIEDALLGAAIPDVRTIAETPASVRAAIVRALPSVVKLNRAENAGGDPRFKEDLGLAVQGLAELRQSESRSVDDLLTQNVMTPQPWRTDRAVALMRLFEEHKPTHIAKRLGEYATAVEDAQSGQSRLMGGVQTAEEAFNEIIGQKESGDQAEPSGEAMFGPSQEDDAATLARARAHFGVTKDANEAGYVLPDGSMLDFSGRSKLENPGIVDLTGQRNTDHADLGPLVPPGAPHERRLAFQRTGAVRVDFNAGIMESSQPLSQEAMKTIVRGFAKTKAPMTIETVDPETGRQVAYENLHANATTREIATALLKVNDAAERHASKPMFGPSEETDAERINTDALGFHSRAQDFIGQKIKGPQPASQVLKSLRNAQLSPDEMKWTGLDDMLIAKGDEKVTPAELKAFMEENRVQLQEKTLGGEAKTEVAAATRALDAADHVFNVEAQRFIRDAVGGTTGDAEGAAQNMRHLARSGIRFDEAAEQTEDYVKQGRGGSKNWTNRLADDTKLRDLYDTLRIKAAQQNEALRRFGGNDAQYSDFTLPGGENYREVLLTLPGADEATVKAMDEKVRSGTATQAQIDKFRETQGFRSSHFNEPNIIAHMRLKDRTTPDGKRVLFAEEIQSDWHQAGRERGYQPTEVPKDAVFERDGRWRIRGAHDPSSNWPTRAEAEAFYLKTANNSGVPAAPFSKTWHEMAFRQLLRLASEGGYDAVGWTTGKQQDERYGIGTAAGGGEGGAPAGEPGGMSEFYDRILPRYADKFGKKFGAKTDRGEISTSTDRTFTTDQGERRSLEMGKTESATNIHLLPITPPMRKSITERGIPLFGPAAEDPSDPGKFGADLWRGAGQIPEHLGRAGKSTGIPDLVNAPKLVMEAAAFEAARDETVGGNFLTRRLAEYLGRADTMIKAVASDIARGGVKQPDQAQAAQLTKERASEAAAQATYYKLKGDDEEAKRWEKMTDRLRSAGNDTGSQRQQDARTLRSFASKLGQGFSRLAQRYENNDVGAATSALKGLTKSEREDIGRIGLGLIKPSEASPAAREAALKVQNTLDKGEAGMESAAAVGLKRKSPKGGYYKLRGSGLFMPMGMNAEGRAVLADLAKSGRESPKFNALLDAMQAQKPDASRADLAETALDYFDSLSRGVNRYFERTRTMLPERYLELDPAKVLPSVIRKNARTVAAGRVFGGYDDTNSLPEVDDAIVAMRQHDPDQAARLSKYIGMEMGKPPTAGNAKARQIAGTVTGVQNITKLSTIFGPIRNATQPWINTADFGLIPRLRGYFVDYPLLVHRLTPSGRRARDVALRAGSISAAPTGALGSDTNAPLPTKVGRGITNAAMYAFSKSQEGTQVRADAIARAAAEKGLADLASLERPGFGVRKLLTQAANGFGTDRARSTVQRRMARLGLTPGRLAEAVASGRRLTPDELDLAGWHMAHDTQFILTTASKPLFYENSPLLRIAAQYKTFGMRQTGLMVDRALKESGRGNFVPLAQFGLATLVAGELLALLRDYIKGEDKSITGNLIRTGDMPKAAEAASRAAGHLTKGGLVGAVGDTEFGIGSYLIGPTGGMAKDVLKAGMNVAQRPTLGQAGLAGRRLIEQQAGMVNQATGIYRQVIAANKRPIAVAMLRAKAAKTHTLGENLQQRIFGPDEYRGGPATLTYQYAARAINAGDVAGATEYMTSLLAGLEGHDLEIAINGLKASMNSKSPLGGQSQAKDRELLATMSPEARRAAVELNRDWRSDYMRALRDAARAAREAKRKGKP